MSDLIDSQAAIDAIKASTSKYTGFMEMEMYTDDDAIKAVNSVPSAEPVRHGKWIEKSTGGEHFDCCSECGYIEWDAPNNYCPNCGCRMDKDGR